jgi:hypothetical protein
MVYEGQQDGCDEMGCGFVEGEIAVFLRRR